MQIPDNIYFYGTCLVDLLYPQAGLAAMDLIKKAGVNVIYPKQQSCCGQPAFNSGYRAEALQVARQQMTCFPKNIPIVIPSGSCAGMIKHHWPELFAGEKDQQQANQIASRVFELSEFLVDVLDIKLADLGPPVKIAIHTSCSARREMGVADKIDSLIAQLNNVEVIEQKNKAECCGFGGTFAIKQADISGAMVNHKSKNILATGAEVLISEDCGCLTNIGGAIEKQHKSLRVMHLAEFIKERS
ncbi:MAG: (Fe-S)-binding protein [Pseudomonadota bacterium]